jgi:hypothetical protein
MTEVPTVRRPPPANTTPGRADATPRGSRGAASQARPGRSVGSRSGPFSWPGRRGLAHSGLHVAWQSQGRAGRPGSLGGVGGRRTRPCALTTALTEHGFRVGLDALGGAAATGTRSADAAAADSKQRQRPGNPPLLFRAPLNKPRRPGVIPMSGRGRCKVARGHLQAAGATLTSRVTASAERS